MWEPRKTIVVCAIALAELFLFAESGWGAEPLPQTQPATRFAGAGGLIDPVGIVERLRNQIEQLELRPVQKAALEELFDKSMQDAQALQREVRDLRPMERMQRLQPFVANLRQRLAELLEQRQLQILRQHATTQPFGGGVLPGAPQAEVQRLRQSLDRLDLSADQKKQVADDLAAAQQKLQAFQQNRVAAGAAGPGQILIEVRQELRNVLTPDQLQRLRESMGTPGGGVPTDPAKPLPNRRPRNSAADDASAPASRKASATTHPTVGMDAPEFHLQSLGGAMVDLAKFHGRVVVMEFGSAGSPTFRDHVAAMEKLYQQYGSRCSMLIVYTHEAHQPDNSAGADKDDGIAIQQAADYSSRRSAAEKMRVALNVKIPILIDTMDDAVTDAYGGFPNATVVIGKDGKIAGRQQWNDPSGLGRVIDGAMGDAPKISEDGVK